MAIVIVFGVYEMILLFMTRFAVRWPAPDDGQSIGWRLIFWLLFHQGKSDKKPPAKAEIPIFAKHFL